MIRRNEQKCNLFVLCVFQKNKILFAIRRTAARIGRKVQQQLYDPLPIIAWRQTHLWCLTNEPASTWWQMCVSFHHNFVIKCTFAARFLCTRVHALSSIYVFFSFFWWCANSSHSQSHQLLLNMFYNSNNFSILTKFRTAGYIFFKWLWSQIKFSPLHDSTTHK